MDLRFKKIALLALIAALLVLFFSFNLNSLITFEGLKSTKGLLLDLYMTYPILVFFVYCIIYLVIVSFNLPGALILGLAAGAIFGFIKGVLIVSFMSSISATVACYISRFLLRDSVSKRFSTFIQKIDDGIRDEGVFYLFALRLVPVIPFFIVNMVMGITDIDLKKYYIVSQIGMLPGTMVIVNAGKELGTLDSLNGIMSPNFILSLILIGVLPIILKKILGFTQRYIKEAGDVK